MSSTVEDQLQALKINAAKHSNNPEQQKDQTASPSSSDSALASSIVDNAGKLVAATVDNERTQAAGDTRPIQTNTKYSRNRRRSSTNNGMSIGSKGSPELINPDPMDVELEALASGRNRKLSGSNFINEGMYVFYPDDDINGCNQAIQATKSVRKGSLSDRKKRTTVSLSLTKNGGGGKFTWGRPGDEWKSSCPSGARDCKDPNFDEFEEDENTVYRKCGLFYSDQDIVNTLASRFQDYLCNGDDKELIENIMDLQHDQINCNVLSRIFFHINMWGLEASRKNRGHVWALYNKLFADNDIKYAQLALTQSFENFIDARAVLKIDCPDYDDYIQKLIACFLYKFNEIDTPFFNDYLESQVEKRQHKFGAMVGSARSIAQRLKSDFQIMASIWTCDDYLTTEQLSLAMAKLVDDWTMDGYSYISLGDELKEFFKTPNFYHELIYLLLLKTVNKSTREVMQYCVQTMEYLVIHRDIIKSSQVKLAFLRLFKEMDELAIDIPSVHVLVGLLVKHCHEKKLIDDEVRVKLPKRKGDRRRVKSEMQHNFRY